MRKIFTAAVFFFILFYMTGTPEECPQTNKITKMTSQMESFQAVQPLDFTNLKSVGALAKRQDQKIEVYLSNGTFTINQMSSSFIVPIKKKDEFIAVIHFSNGNQAVTPGTYTPKAGFGKPLWAFAEVKLYKPEKGVIVSLGVKEGTARIISLTEDRICGVFDLYSPKDSHFFGEISGEFNVPLEKSKW